MNKVRLALLGGLLCVCTVTLAQETNTKKEKTAKYEAMMEKLELSEDQKSEVEALKLETKTKIKTLKADSTIAEADLHAQVKELKELNREKFDEILTDDQRLKLKEIKAEYKKKNDKTPGEMAAKQTEKMTELLDLTDDQVEKVRALNLKVANKIDVIRKDESMTAEKKKEFIKGNKADHKTMMQSILTEEQFQTYEEHLAARKKLRAHPKVKPTNSTEEKVSE